MSELIGHDSLRQELNRQIEQGQFGQTVALSGPEGIGKFLLAKQLAARLLGAEQKQSADLLVIEPDEKGHITIDRMREVMHFLATYPYAAARKVVIIRDAEALGLDAQQAILKTLEEPPHFAHILLVVSRMDALLDTVRSRCQRFELEYLAWPLLEAYFARQSVDALQLRLLWFRYGGSIGRLSAQLAAGGADEIVERFKNLSQLCTATPRQRMAWSSEQAPADWLALRELLRDWQAFWRLLLHLRQAMVDADQVTRWYESWPWLQRVSKLASVAKITQAQTEVQNMLESLQAGINSTLWLDDLLLAMPIIEEAV